MIISKQFPVGVSIGNRLTLRPTGSPLQSQVGPYAAIVTNSSPYILNIQSSDGGTFFVYPWSRDMVTVKPTNPQLAIEPLSAPVQPTYDDSLYVVWVQPSDDISNERFPQTIPVADKAAWGQLSTQTLTNALPGPVPLIGDPGAPVNNVINSLSIMVLGAIGATGSCTVTDGIGRILHAAPAPVGVYNMPLAQPFMVVAAGAIVAALTGTAAGTIVVVTATSATGSIN